MEARKEGEKRWGKGGADKGLFPAWKLLQAFLASTGKPLVLSSGVPGHGEKSEVRGDPKLPGGQSLWCAPISGAQVSGWAADDRHRLPNIPVLHFRRPGQD